MSAADVLGLVGSTVDGVPLDACVDSADVAVVYRGLHPGLHQPVAVKCLRLSHVGGDAASRDAAIGRFRDETKILQHLTRGTTDIVRCYASGEVFAPATGERVHYMILEWLEGRTLRADLDERRQRGLPGRSLVEALDLLESVALAIAHAHSQGIVHRAITPSKLYLARTRGGVRLKVLDFGVAKILSHDLSHHSVGFEQSVKTMNGAQLCSPAYGAPEQFNPRLGAIDAWTDVYSLTLVLLEVMLGEPVRNATTVAEGLMKALDPASGSPRPSRLGLALPPLIDDLLTRAVAQRPVERPANAGVLWSALRELTRMNAAPVRDAAALAPTAMAGDVADAIVKMRAAIPAKGAPAEGPSPFHGTMLMVGAPGGPLQLHGAEPHDPRGARGAPAPASPLAASLGPGVPLPVPAGPSGASPAPFRPPTPVGMTRNLHPSSPGLPAARTSTPAPAPSRGRGPGLVVTLLVVLVIGVAIAGGLLLLLRSR